jgi:hypothetical protein
MFNRTRVGKYFIQVRARVYLVIIITKTMMLTGLVLRVREGLGLGLGLATFYTMFNRTRVGKYFIQVRVRVNLVIITTKTMMLTG